MKENTQNLKKLGRCFEAARKTIGVIVLVIDCYKDALLVPEIKKLHVPKLDCCMSYCGKHRILFQLLSLNLQETR